MSNSDLNKTFPLDRPINLHIRVAHGSVTIEPEDGLDEARVHVAADKHAADLLEQTTVELRGNTLSVIAPRQGGIFDLPVFGAWRAGRGLQVHVVVPSGTAVKISTFTAPIRILGRVGDADLSFGSGEAAVRHVDGDLRLRYGSGMAKIVRVSGSVQLRSGSGNAQFGEVDGDLMAGCGSGDLQIRVMRGAVRSRCGSGDARLGEVHGDVDVASGSGGVELGLPSGVTARLDVHTGSGQVRSELPIDDEPKSAGAAAIRVRARTGSGDVRLFRAA
ncbi:MAG TPA: DUF4097 family beta strand repeat-containing protein [Jatrophihabitans sp.]|jgi:hypothetical protein|nr:DUF4097 family beta strand repeat-containing protein [Jatrophihabitans sp.]